MLYLIAMDPMTAQSFAKGDTRDSWAISITECILQLTAQGQILLRVHEASKQHSESTRSMQTSNMEQKLKCARRKAYLQGAAPALPFVQTRVLGSGDITEKPAN